MSVRSSSALVLGIASLLATSSPRQVRAEATDNDPRRAIPPARAALVVRDDGQGNIAVVTPAPSTRYTPYSVGPVAPASGARRFRVFVDGGQTGGTVAATAYDRGVCSVVSWAPETVTTGVSRSTKLAIDMAYFPPADAPSQPLTCAIVYSKVLDRSALRAPLAYGLFALPSAPQQTAIGLLGFNSAGPAGMASSPRSTRTSAGRYRVEIPRMGAGDVSGNVIVTPYGAVDRICRAGTLARSGTDSIAFEVRCDESRPRQAADTGFTFLFTRGGSAWGWPGSFVSGMGGPDGLMGGAGEPSQPTVGNRGGLIGGLAAGSVMLMTSTKDDAACRPVFGPSQSSITVRCDGGAGGYYFLASP